MVNAAGCAHRVFAQSAGRCGGDIHSEPRHVLCGHESAVGGGLCGWRSAARWVTASGYDRMAVVVTAAPMARAVKIKHNVRSRGAVGRWLSAFQVSIGELRQDTGSIGQPYFRALVCVVLAAYL